MEGATNWPSVLRDYVTSPSDMDLDGNDAGRSRNYDTTDQLPSPPLSHESDIGTPEQDNLVSISTTFFPSANHERLGPANLVLRSQDAVYFYCHIDFIKSVSDNNFDNLLPAQTTDNTGSFVTVFEPAVVLNIILHAIYNLSCAHYAPTFDDLTAAVAALQKYGVSIRQRMSPHSILFAQIMTHVPEASVDIYVLAASYDLYDLAIAVSPHLLSYNLSNITDEMAAKIGPIFLKRLFFQHFGRSEALKRLLLQPPHPHAPTPDCDFDEQKKVTRAWALASAYIAWDAKPDLSTTAIDSTLTPLGEHLSCQACKKSLQDRIHTLIVSWSEIKRTI